MLLTPTLILTASCTEYVNVPRSDWDVSASDSTGDWKIETAMTVYVVQRFTTTDSTVVLLDARRKELVGGVSYPGSAITAIERSELPIVLRSADVVSIDRGQFSKGRTVGAILGIAATTTAVAIVGFWIYAESHGGLY